MKKFFLILGLIVLIGGGVTGYYLYNKPHENIGKAKADYEIDAETLFTTYESDENAANGTYLDKIVQVKGTVDQVKKNEEGIISVTLNGGGMMFGVICQLDELTEHKRTEFETGEEVVFKGICTGMLMDVVLVRCVEVGE